MMKTIYSKLTGLLLPALTATLFALSSCVPQTAGEDVSDEMITLSESELLFANNGGTKEVSVTGAETWDFLSSEGETGWIKLEKNGNTLSVNVEPNPDGGERIATVMVIGKTTQAKFNVTQSPADFVLDFSEDVVTFPSDGGDKLIIVNANSDEWSFDPIPEEASWLSLKSGKEVVTLTATANDSYEMRSVGLIVTSATGEKRELTVNQTGIRKYFEPYMPAEGKPYRPVDLLKFEAERGNVVTYYAEPSVFYGALIPGDADFITTSDITPFVSYNTELEGQPLYSDALITVLYSDLEARPELGEYKEFIKGFGFTPDDEEETRFRNEGAQLKLTFDEANMTDGFVATFNLYYPQPQAFPTFNPFPYGPEGVLGKLNDPRVKSEDIQALEEGLGSTLITDQRDPADPDNTAALQFYETGKTGKFDEAMRIYWYVTTEDGVPEFLDTPTQLDLLFDDYTAAFWQAEGGKLIMTEEFTDLIREEGYTLYAIDEQGNYFYVKPFNASVDQALVVDVHSYEGIFDGKLALHIAHFYSVKQQMGSVSLRDKIELLKIRGSKDARYILANPQMQAIMDRFYETRDALIKH